MRRLLSVAMVVVIGIAGITWFSLASAPLVHAQASCTGVSFYLNDANEQVGVPTIGNNTHNDNCDLGVGNDSNAVGWLQFDLNQCYDQSIAQDNIFGPATKEALQDAQAEAGVAQDGVYGPITRDHITWVNTGGAGEGACFKL
jgi:hypothetical protein